MRNANLLAAVLAALALGAAPALHAEDRTVVGPVTHIELAPDGKSATATLKDGNTGEEVKVTITDELTLDKFRDKRIGEGDEVRARFDKTDGRNSSKSFRKTAGC
jgi:hypothetical protein